jgi:hypothetical protein
MRCTGQKAHRLDLIGEGSCSQMQISPSSQGEMITPGHGFMVPPHPSSWFEHFLPMGSPVPRPEVMQNFGVPFVPHL